MDETTKNVESETTDSKAKLRIWLTLSTLLLTVLCIFAVMFAFYDEPNLIDGIDNTANQLYGLENYGPFFTQMYGNMLFLGIGTFLVATASLMIGSMFSATSENKGAGKVITYIVLMVLAMISCATICIYVLGGIAVIIASIYLVLAKTGSLYE